MNDTAIPIPTDAAQRMAGQAQAALDVFARALAPVAEEMERKARVVGSALQQGMQAAAQRQRVRNTMPTLTVREVLVHGYVPHTVEPDAPQPPPVFP